MRLFLISNFSIGVIVYLLITCVLGPIMLWLQFIKGLSPLYAGLYMLPAAAFALIASLVMPYLLTRFIARVIMFSGLIFTTISLMLPSILDYRDLLSNTMLYILDCLV